jgi:hypothetical protein
MNLAWYVPRPSRLRKHPLVIGETAIYVIWEFFLLGLVALYFSFRSRLLTVHNILSFNWKKKKKVGDSPADSVKKKLMNNEHVDKLSPYNFSINYVNIQVHLEIINFKIKNL